MTPEQPEGEQKPTAPALTEAQIDRWRESMLRLLANERAVNALCDLARSALRGGSYAEGYAAAREAAAKAAFKKSTPPEIHTDDLEYCSGYAKGREDAGNEIANLKPGRE